MRQRDKEEDVAAEYQCAGYKGLICNSTHSIDSRRGRVEVVVVVVVVVVVGGGGVEEEGMFFSST